jgi:disulfide bond formation protein DsbB
MTIDSRHLKAIDAAALLGISVVLLGAFYYQLVQGELPCAFCNLIRVGFMLLGSGFLMNLYHGTKASNYVLSAVGALIGSLISLLFMFAKAPSWTTPTGSAVLGLHMYTWTYIIFTAAIMFCLAMLALTAGAKSNDESPDADAFWLALSMALSMARSAASALFILLVAANLVSAFLENGFDTFRAGGQQHYQMLYDGDVMKP